MQVMNTAPASLLEPGKAFGMRMWEILNGVGWLRDVSLTENPAPFERAFDWLATFKVPKGPTVELWIDVRQEPRPAHFPYVNVEREFDDSGAKTVRARVFGAPWLSPRMRERCEKHGWSWYDLAGNCRISVPGVLHVERTGKEPVHRLPKQGANLGTREAGRVVRALLAPFYTGRTWTQRFMQMNCKPNVSLGLVNKVVQYLREEAYLESLPDGGFRVIDPIKLLFAWREAYRFDQHRRLGYFTLLQGKQLRQKLAELDAYTGGFAAYAAFSAADFQAPHVRQTKTWLYVAGRELARFAEMTEAKPVDTGENLVVLEPADDGVFFQADGGTTGEDRLRCTNLVQTYIDLWHCGGRGKEAAEALLEQRLKPVWAGQELPR